MSLTYSQFCDRVASRIGRGLSADDLNYASLADRGLDCIEILITFETCRQYVPGFSVLLCSDDGADLSLPELYHLVASALERDSELEMRAEKAAGGAR